MINDTMTYFSYCNYAHNQGFRGFTIWCSTQISFDFIAALNVFPLCFLLYIEIRIQQQIGWRRPAKFTALTFMIVSQLIVFFHYFIAWPSDSGLWFRGTVLF